MKYKVTKECNLKAILNKKIQSFDYALLYQFSECRLCKMEDLTDFDWDECMEARLFSRQKEFHFFPREGYGFLIEDRATGENAAETEADEATIDTEVNELTSGTKTGQQWKEAIQIERNYQLAHTDVWKTVAVYQYLEQDEDGQNRIVLTRLADLNQQEV